MNLPNPYEPPATPRTVEAPVQPSTKSDIALLVFPTLVSAVLGSIAFGPYCGMTPTDPRGPGIAAGLSGLAGLVLAIAHRHRTRTAAQSSAINP